MIVLENQIIEIIRPIFAASWIHFIACLGLCAAYIQGGFNKLYDFPGAISEMTQFGLSPARLFVIIVIILEFVASALIITGFFRWAGALALAGFTFLATLRALRFWTVPKEKQMVMANAFFEHFGLIGGLLLIAWIDLNNIVI